jgi:hypothetical protein
MVFPYVEGILINKGLSVSKYLVCDSILRVKDYYIHGEGIRSDLLDSSTNMIRLTSFNIVFNSSQGTQPQV